jgi:threonine aldolase
MAKHLRSTLQSQNSTSLPDEKGNIVFQYIPNQETLEKLKAVGCSPYQWPKPWDHRPSKNRYRLVVPWNAKQEDVDLVSKIINEGRLSKNHMNELDEPEQQAVVGLG